MLSEIQRPEQLRALTFTELDALAAEIRALLVKTVMRQGGHLASNLGAVELTIALHCALRAPEDKIVFDVGHQAYVHKLLTGRAGAFETLREKDGLSGFPRASESPYDAFSTGHASTAISAALGLARARDLRGEQNAVVAVVGDGALTGGMCYEALNDAGRSDTPLIVILNDNEMSISKNVGAMANYLTTTRQSSAYRQTKKAVKSGLTKLPVVGDHLASGLARVRDSFRQLLTGDQFFSALGFEYYGPIDGHDIAKLVRAIKLAREQKTPVLLHVVTQKGRGCRDAELHPERYHGVSPAASAARAQKPQSGAVAAKALIHLAAADPRVVVLTAAMPDGTHMADFAARYPARFFDAGIAEEHLVTMAAGMAAGGLRPYVAIYSTFLQRAYDQLIHDVCLQNLPVTLLIDRAGLVGPDGATHQGVFDLSFLRAMPNMTVASPSDAGELRRLIEYGATLDAPFALRYAKDIDPAPIANPAPIVSARWTRLSPEGEVEILAVGRMTRVALDAAKRLAEAGVSCGVTNARFVKPLDEEALAKMARNARLIVTLEEGVAAGGFGSGVLELLSESRLSPDTLTLGVPDRFIEHAETSEQWAMCGLDAESVSNLVKKRLDMTIM